MSDASAGTVEHEQPHSSSAVGLMVGAVGVCYGDIGTSPLYTLKEVFVGGYGVQANHDGVLGVLSLIFWSLIWVVSIKYVIFVLRADNQGEGGVMALSALARRAATGRHKLQAMVVIAGLIGAALFYGDSMITPAISVLSAIEGLEIAFDGLEHWVVPLSLIVLVGLFLIQKHGTARIGILFGPVMVAWFLALAALGIYGVAQQPEVLKAMNPGWAVNFFISHPGIGVAILGATVLALTGAEALYADMGHFGRKPIARAWFALVLPALVLNYFGQGATILVNAEAARNPFYLTAPSWALVPLVALSTAATVIASQAVISGAFSLTRQAIQLGYVPRMVIQHTSSHEQGQIYIGMVNWALMVGVVLLVLGFESSAALASAYGVAVTGTMLMTTLLMGVVIWLMWKWPLWLAIPFFLMMLFVDTLFFAANLPKVVQGGAFPVIAGIGLFILMTTWKRGRQLLVDRLDEGSLPLPLFISSIRSQPPHRVQGTAVFLTARTDAVPHALLHNLLHNQVLHEQVVLLTVVNEDSPRVAPDRRFEVDAYGEGFFRVVLHFGFIEDPDIPQALKLCHLNELDFSPMRTTYFLSRETVIPSKLIGMARWREALFAFLLKNANGNLRYFNLPLNRVIELGTQVEI
ncbi:potassium transporter Kup [Pseudomonas sp. GD04087]|uniref:potassium transporter Kup n=1 Tax=Pseudomonas TaxID=286 RepID=UPI001F3D655C|nr:MULTISPECIES: potassium transporter Kup [Pseudomonas]MCP1647371.1 KUP system potassium uptake protein [Pseudomonas nitroreducens]MCP1685947.1 KUP system potassium uptake protein [Pseudomonas nitroreducens]MDH0291748.1 potassium transporter Kup [Pseudomonas sp. GD04087]MDH1052363.1 potassium transporter Kup [Pseudomonas sp. GD03903]MDH2000929.1 potassium transporter Kup [Pseudomonas sp. GD03691]